MSWWLFLTPLFAAIAGWCLVAAALKLLFRPYKPVKFAGINIQGILPKKQQEVAKQIGSFSASLLSLNEIESKITNPENVKKIMPQAEEHIDHFLRVKLVKSMPMVGMFVGDKTINNLKSLFVGELEQLFPEIMKNYMGGLKEDFNIEQMVSSKIAAIEPAAIEQTFMKTMGKELRSIKLLGALFGFIIAGIQLVLFVIFSH